MPYALIVQGGWEGHYPKEISELLANSLRAQNFTVDISDSLDVFLDTKKLEDVDLIVPNWTMGSLSYEQSTNFLSVVKDGVGVVGLHGGMGDAFRNDTEYQFMVGGQFVAHPGGDGVTYEVRIKNKEHEITEGIENFTVTSELYYMHVDPAIEVLATTNFEETVMPIAWTKSYGKGRVFYCSLGHSPDIVQMDPVQQLMARGMAWAAKK
jgi:uncharacterized protein